MRKQWQLLGDVAWRYLIVLDACRADVFAEVVQDVGLQGRLIACDSQALDTLMWYARHWTGRYPDVALVGAHPYPWDPRLDVAKNFGVARPVFREEGALGWGGVVHPARMMQVVAWEVAAWPGMSFLLHFEQPHLPYIDPEGMTFLAGVLGIPAGGDEWMAYSKSMYDQVQAWARVHGWEGPRAYYAASLRVTLEAIRDGLGCLSNGKVVITADHGECLGEGRVYGHPRGGVRDILTRVPWFEVTR